MGAATIVVAGRRGRLDSPEDMRENKNKKKQAGSSVAENPAAASLLGCCASEVCSGKGDGGGAVNVRYFPVAGGERKAEEMLDCRGWLLNGGGGCFLLAVARRTTRWLLEVLTAPEKEGGGAGSLAARRKVGGNERDGGRMHEVRVSPRLEFVARRRNTGLKNSRSSFEFR